MPSTIYQLTTNFTPEKGSRAISACVQRHQVTVTSFLPEALKFMKLTSGLAAPIEVTHVCTNGKGKRKGREGVSGVKEKRAGEGVCKLLCCAVLCSCSCNVGLVSRDRTDWPKSKKVRPPLPPRAKLRHAMKTVSVHRTVYYRAGTFYWGGVDYHVRVRLCLILQRIAEQGRARQLFSQGKTAK